MITERRADNKHVLLTFAFRRQAAVKATRTGTYLVCILLKKQHRSGTTGM